jgi:hypothetical protein
MNTTRRVRTAASLMCSTAFCVIMLIFASAAPVGAANCCQSCVSLDSTCGGACEDQCLGNQSCLNTCYDDCQARSDACWSHCIFCEYGACSYIWWWVDYPEGDILDTWCV